MKFIKIEEKTLIQYLLGMLSGKIREKVEDQIFTSTIVFEELLDLEEEIIDDYIYGRLSRKQRKYFEKYFLSTPERRKKFEFSQSLKSCLDEWVSENEKTGLAKTLKLSELSHNELVSYLAFNLNDDSAWREFIRRFQQYIASTIILECKRLNYQEGLNNINDFVQAVYLRLLDNGGSALRNFSGRYENAIIQYLKILAINVVRSELGAASKPNFGDIRRNLPASLHDYSKIDSIIPMQELTDTINHALKEIASKHRYGSRNVMIFKLYLYQGLGISEIADLPEFSKITQKRIANIIAEIKAELPRFVSSA